MSVFRVKLQNPSQGYLDIDPSTHAAFAVSKQRTVTVMGPKHITRILKDGDVFTDCNYWKRFAVPQCAADLAFIEVVDDDGSVYSDIASENTTPVGGTFTLATSYNGTNVIDFLGTYGSAANFVQVINNDGSIAITVEINGISTLTFTLPAGGSQSFNINDLAVTKIRMKSASGTPTATVIASVQNLPQS